MSLSRFLSLTLAASLGLTVGDARAQTCPGDDTFEDNDDCASAVTLTAGTHAGLALKGQANAGGLDNDYFVISVPNGQQLTVDALFSHAGGDIDLLLYEGLGCATLTSIGGTATDDETVVATNTSGATQDYSLWVDAYGTTFDCNDYTLVVTISSDPCAVPMTDPYEDNDDCPSAQVLPGGGAVGLNTQNGDEDFYIITAAPSSLTLIDVNFLHAAGDIDAVLYADIGCVTQAAISQTVSDNESVSYQNTTAGPIDLVLNVYGYGPGFGCNDYDIVVSTAVDPCLSLPEDGNEEDDDCNVANVVGDGLVAGQATFIGDPDWFEVSLTDGETVTFDALFVHANGDLDIELLDACNGNQIGLSQSVDDNEQIIWTNTTGATTTVYLEVYVWQGSTYACNGYDLDVTLTGGVAGSPMCAGDGSAGACPCGNESAPGAGEGCSHSGGVGAILETDGTNSVGADDLTFTVTQAIANQPSMLVQGAALVAVPFKDGLLCTGNPTERIEIVFLDGSGAGTSSASIVTEGAVSPGDTRYYQQWYRNPGGVSPCGSGSNFSSGIVVVFEP